MERKANIDFDRLKYSLTGEYEEVMLEKQLKEKNKEIEKLKERIKDLNTINEEHQILNGIIRKELQQKENIIKEVRECIEKEYVQMKNKEYNLSWNNLEYIIKELLEILDKENK